MRRGWGCLRLEIKTAGWGVGVAGGNRRNCRATLVSRSPCELLNTALAVSLGGLDLSAAEIQCFFCDFRVKSCPHSTCSVTPSRWP